MLELSDDFKVANTILLHKVKTNTFETDGKIVLKSEMETIEKKRTNWKFYKWKYIVWNKNSEGGLNNRMEKAENRVSEIERDQLKWSNLKNREKKWLEKKQSFRKLSENIRSSKKCF